MAAVASTVGSALAPPAVAGAGVADVGVAYYPQLHSAEMRFQLQLDPGYEPNAKWE